MKTVTMLYLSDQGFWASFLGQTKPAVLVSQPKPTAHDNQYAGYFVFFLFFFKWCEEQSPLGSV